MKLLIPTNKVVCSYIEIFNKDERYYPADQAIINLFSAFPENKKVEDILLKISVINDLYSTNILGTFKMAKYIQSLDIDQRLLEGDPNVVNSIAVGHGICSRKSGKELVFYSFATKYCNWHNRYSYAIYDTFVERLLLTYQKISSFSRFSKADLRDFSKFKQVIHDFINHFQLNDHNLKEIDKFLWMHGKELFSKKTITASN